LRKRKKGRVVAKGGTLSEEGKSSRYGAERKKHGFRKREAIPTGYSNHGRVRPSVGKDRHIRGLINPKKIGSNASRQ